MIGKLSTDTLDGMDSFSRYLGFGDAGRAGEIKVVWELKSAHISFAPLHAFVVSGRRSGELVFWICGRG